MKKRISLPSGREHELLLGLTVNREDDILPDVPYASFRKSMRDIMHSELYIPGEDGGSDTVYNPLNPNWGGSDILFMAVKGYLPRRPKNSLELHLAVDTALDIHHGVDCFFLWMNEYYVTIDLSLRQKGKRGSVDIIVNLNEMTPEELAQKISSLLMEKRQKGEVLTKSKKRRKKEKFSETT